MLSTYAMCTVYVTDNAMCTVYVTDNFLIQYVARNPLRRLTLATIASQPDFAHIKI